VPPGAYHDAFFRTAGDGSQLAAAIKAMAASAWVCAPGSHEFGSPHPHARWHRAATQ